MNRQRVLLTALVAILAVALAYAFWATPRQQRATQPQGPARTPQGSAARQVARPVDEARVRLELLNRQEDGFPGAKRDIFRYPVVAPPPAPKPSPPPPPPPPEPEPEPVAEPEPVVPVEVQRELARFTFLGFLEKEGVKTIFLSAAGELFVVKKGDRFGKSREFLVTALSAERLTIRQGDDPRAITVPLVEQAPLVPEGIRGTLPPQRQGTMHSAGEGRADAMGALPPVEKETDEREILPPGGAANE